MPNLMAIPTNVEFPWRMSLRASYCVHIESKQIKYSTHYIVDERALHAEIVPIVVEDYLINDCMA